MFSQKKGQLKASPERKERNGSLSFSTVTHNYQLCMYVPPFPPSSSFSSFKSLRSLLSRLVFVLLELEVGEKRFSISGFDLILAV